MVTWEPLHTRDPGKMWWSWRIMASPVGQKEVWHPGTSRLRLWLWLPRMLMPPLWVSASLTLTSFNITSPPAFLSGQTRCLWESTLYTVRHYISFLRAIVSKCHNSGAYHNRNVLSHSFGVWIQGGGRAMCPLKPGGRILCYFWGFAGNPWLFLACRWITLISAPIHHTAIFFPCVSVSVFLLLFF